MSKVGAGLVLPFNAMTTFYFRRSVEKAFQLDEQPSDLSLNMNKLISSNAPYITSAVDDVMYIVNQVIQRCLATCQNEVVASVVPMIARVLGSDFFGMIQRKMRDESYPKPVVQGGKPPEHIIVAFLVLMNNLDVATDYVKRIVQSRLESLSKNGSSNGEASSQALSELFPFHHGATLATNALKSLQTTFETKTSELISDGTIVVFKNVMKPLLRPILADSFRDIDYSLNEEELEALNREAEIDGNEVSPATEDAVPRRFQHGWEALTKPIARILTAANFDRLLIKIIDYLGEVLEKRMWSYYGRINSYGAIRLERDIANVVGVVVRGRRYGLRDSFARCIQICLVANMENDEWEELQGTRKGAGDDGGLEWKLDAEEQERARAMVRNPM